MLGIWQQVSALSSTSLPILHRPFKLCAHQAIPLRKFPVAFLPEATAKVI